MSIQTGSPPELDLDQTFGAFMIGTLVGVMLYGITIHQVYQYLRTYTDDSAAYKTLVVLVAMLETLHTVICAHAWHVGIPNRLVELFSRFSIRKLPLPGPKLQSINALTGLSGIVIILSQSYFTRRVFLIGSSLRVLVYAAIILFVGELAFFAAQAFAFPLFEHFQQFTWLISAGAAMAFLGDALLTSVLVTVLRRNITGMKRIDTVVDILILYAISTGLLTSVVNFLSFIFSLVSPSKLVYTAFGIVATKLYANSLLTALNARKYLAQRATVAVLPDSLMNSRATRVLHASPTSPLVDQTYMLPIPPYSQQISDSDITFAV
ncbi:hypothetical protein BC628DRAFT_1414564 [Trametes gibbosa]|nr:hypothetical protein BC628DRAFT_1414564 [Trametes gibbosa]